MSDNELDDTDLSGIIDGLADLRELLRSSLAASTRVEDEDGEAVAMQVEVHALMFGLWNLKDAIANLRRLRRETTERVELEAGQRARLEMDRWDR